MPPRVTEIRNHLFASVTVFWTSVSSPGSKADPPVQVDQVTWSEDS